MNNSEQLVGIIEDVINTIPELKFFAASPVTKNSYNTLVVLADPKVRFRQPGQFTTHEAAKLGTRPVQCSFIDASWSMDTALASMSDWGTSAALALQATTHLRSALFNLSRQIWYGGQSDSAGFPGLYQLISGSGDARMNENLQIDAHGRETDTDSFGNTGLSSVWAVSTGLDSIQIAWGNNGKLHEGDIDKVWIPNPGDPNNRGRWDYAQEISGWAGLQVTSQWAFGRIKNISPDVVFTDDYIYRLLSNFPIGRKPQALFMTSRVLEQLRRSRTAVNATGAPAPVPDSVAGVPIYVSDAIDNHEESLNLV
jgi:hypothetical protein